MNDLTAYLFISIILMALGIFVFFATRFVLDEVGEKFKKNSKLAIGLTNIGSFLLVFLGVLFLLKYFNRI